MINRRFEMIVLQEEWNSASDNGIADRVSHYFLSEKEAIGSEDQSLNHRETFSYGLNQK